MDLRIMKRLALALSIAGLALAATAGAASANSPQAGVVVPRCQAHNGAATVPAGSDVVLLAGWFTRSRGLGVAFVHDVTVTPAEVDGAAIPDSGHYWNAPLHITSPAGWHTVWSYDTGRTLASGESISVDFNLVLAHPIADGFGSVSPAGPLLPGTTCTITGV